MIEFTYFHSYKSIPMHLSKEVYRDEHSTHTKQIFYNDKKKVSGILETGKHSSAEHGLLSVYEYTGENYRIVKYGHETKSYAIFKAKGHTILGAGNWHAIDEALSTREYKFEKELLVSDHYHDIRYGTKQSVNYTYENGLKVSETSVNEDGTALKTNYTYHNGILQSKLLLNNNQFSGQFIYVYGNNNVLLEEQQFGKHKDTQFMAAQKKFFYNAKKEVEKTEYYGRYNGKMVLYRTEEAIRQGNVLTKKESSVSSIEQVIGYYDLSALHDTLKERGMDWAVSMYDAGYADRAVFDAHSCSIEKYDDKGNVSELKQVDPQTRETFSTTFFRNEYNEKSQLEFTICYKVVDDRKMEESSIRKFYYLD
ncbi:hypothetical protein [Chitinophaga filiformis]|uniref:YD repeat-containing protein n=1 Tax=Chitinophaga filiformis TaxID=104663 RepID=A0ABY4HYR9_CHIFI|nr:hypothetical protein [Chitinophaga filiformis]UPK68550.1 hypothetical protein MYF79_26695 [Chitinophaga filiformis]